MGFHKDYLVSIDISYFFATFLYLVLPSITQFYWVSIHVTQLFFCISNGITQFYWVFTEFFFFAFYSVVQLFPGADGNNFVAMATRANRVYLVFQFFFQLRKQMFFGDNSPCETYRISRQICDRITESTRSAYVGFRSVSFRYLFVIFALTTVPSAPFFYRVLRPVVSTITSSLSGWAWGWGWVGGIKGGGEADGRTRPLPWRRPARAVAATLCK